jgi:hypothetical protein
VNDEKRSPLPNITLQFDLPEPHPLSPDTVAGLITTPMHERQAFQGALHTMVRAASRGVDRLPIRYTYRPADKDAWAAAADLLGLQYPQEDPGSLSGYADVDKVHAVVHQIYQTALWNQHIKGLATSQDIADSAALGKPHRFYVYNNPEDADSLALMLVEKGFKATRPAQVGSINVVEVDTSDLPEAPALILSEAPPITACVVLMA